MTIRTFAHALATSACLLAAPALAATDPALGYDDARHLLARTGFGPTDAEVRAYAPLTRSAAVAKLLRETRTTAVTLAPASALDASPLRAPRGEASATERKAFRDAQIRETLALRGWWLREMLATPSPLTERMTLFWHNHFVSAQPKVRVARLMYRQNATLRANALGNFGALLHAIAKDPAMLVYLDGVQNRKGAPNENFAREVMELFTLGEGHYGERDVKEAARSFTGWGIDRETGAFALRPRLHDDGVKTVLGKSGDFDGDAVLDILLARPETAEFIVAKLWREFVSPDPDPAEVVRIAKRFRESGYEIKAALSAILTSDAFYAPANRGVLVKSPLEVVVGTLRPFAIEPSEGLPFAFAAATMGQNLLAPPNVKGWPGGDAWINTSTLLARKTYLERLTRADDTAMIDAATAGVESRLPPCAWSAPSTAGAAFGDRACEQAEMGAEAPAAAVTAAADDKARQQRFFRRMERRLASVHLDATRLLAQLPGATREDRTLAAERLLLAVAPEHAPDPSADAPTLVRALLLDPAFQLK